MCTSICTLSHTGWVNHLYTVSDVLYDSCVTKSGYTTEYISDSNSPSCGHISGISTACRDTWKTGEMSEERGGEGREKERNQ